MAAKDTATTTDLTISAAPAAESSVEADDYPLSLEEFCARLSAQDRRVEMIGGFYADERRAGQNMDREINFRERFAAFCGRSV